MDLSVIVPIYNEYDYIDKVIDDLVNADFFYEDEELKVEFLLIDGGSTDGTLEKIDKRIKSDERLKLIENPYKYQVHALNIGIKEALGKVIIRCDAHSKYPNKYFIKLYDFLMKNRSVGNVGFKSITKEGSSSNQAKVVKQILSSPFGIGLSHRSKSFEKPIEVDTLLFGAWHREIFDEVGSFDESFIRGQDYEHNYRIRKFGKKVLIIPGEEFFYYTRESLFKMFKMIFQYAHAKVHILSKYKELPTIRFMAPLILWLCIIFSFFSDIFLVPVIIYLILVLFFSIKLSSSTKVSYFGLFFVGLIGVHFSYFIGIIKGFIDYFIKKNKIVNFKETR